MEAQYMSCNNFSIGHVHLKQQKIKITQTTFTSLSKNAAEKKIKNCEAVSICVPNLLPKISILSSLIAISFFGKWDKDFSRFHVTSCGWCVSSLLILVSMGLLQVKIQCIKGLFDCMGKRPSKVSHQSAVFRDRGSGDIMWSYKITWSSDPVKICGWQVAPW